jgi:hypothetical protein
MTETKSDIRADITNSTIANSQHDARPWNVGHAAGTTSRALPSNRNHHRVSNPRRRPPMSQEQRQKLSLAQKAYVAGDPRWAEHRRKLADAQIARRMTLLPDELAMVLAMRSKGRTFTYIEEEIGVCRDVIRRELAERGYSTAHVRSEKRAKRGRGFWRSFD